MILINQCIINIEKKYKNNQCISIYTTQLRSQ